jgi:hypothetical protein
MEIETTVRRGNKPMRKRLLLLLMLAGMFLSTRVGEGQGDARRIRTVTPVETDAPLVNPDQGWGLWAGPRYFTGKAMTFEDNTAAFGKDTSLFRWILVDWMWSDLEPAEGKYDWKELDRIIEYWSAQGKQVYLRVWITDDSGWDGAPGNEVVPEWLWKDGAKYHEYKGEGNSRKREPDYADESYSRVYLPKAMRFLQALAARYDGPESAVTTWGVMGFGNWGEWHTLWSHYPWPNREVKRQTLAHIIDMYAETFHKQKIIAFVYDSDQSEVKTLDEFLYRQALDVGVKDGFGMARHGFIDGLGLVDRLAMEKYWKTTPIFAEGDWSYRAMHKEHSHGTFAENEEVFAEWHANWGHFYTDAESFMQEMKYDRASLEMGLKADGLGFRLLPISASWPEELPAGNLLLVRSQWVNRNSGHCFMRYPLRYYLVDSSGQVRYSAEDPSFDETSWVKGETYPITSILGIPRDLPVGDYEIRIALTDGKQKPAIRLGIEGDDGELRYKLGTIHILATDVP